jgi:hypothetical protein
MDDEMYAKFITIERLLMIVLSDPKYADALADARSEVHREFGEELTKYFPSDPNYPTREAAIVENFNWVADLIKINHDYA